VAFNGLATKQYWTNKFQMLAPSLEEMDSPAMERALSKTTPGHRQWVVKHITGHFHMEKYGM